MNHFSLDAITAPLTCKTGLTHAVLQSIYNHAASTQNDRARMGEAIRGGSWGDNYLTIVGSRDWTLKREKLTSQTLTMAQRFYEEALSWLADEGHIKSLSVSVWNENANRIGRKVTITLLNSKS